MGHLAVDRTFQLIKNRFYWPKMEGDIWYFISNIPPCSPLWLFTYWNIQWQIKYILLLTDHFIRYTRAYATRKKTAKTTANHLYNDFILRFGIPSKLLHDQGGEFEKEIFIKNLKLWTTSKHPQANKLTESMNQTVLSMLSTLPEKYKSNWKNYLNKVIHAYHCTRHSTTGFSPF